MKGEKTKVCCFLVHKHNNGTEFEQVYLVDKGGHALEPEESVSVLL